MTGAKQLPAEPRETAAQRVHARLAVALLVGAAGFAASVLATWYFRRPSDIDFVLAAARGLLAGYNPYDVVTPARTEPWQYEWPWPLYYPMPAVLGLLPFALLPATGLALVVTRAAVVALGAALCAYAVTREKRWYSLLLFPTLAWAHAVETAQWSPLLTAASLTPALGFVLAMKPNIGAALFLWRPTRAAALGIALVLALSFAVQPGWLGDWLAAASQAPYPPPILRAAGWPLVLAVLRWRQPEARLLLLLACVPQNLQPMEVIPLFLVPRGWRESFALWGLVNAACLLLVALGPYHSHAILTETAAPVLIALCYLPCLIMVLRRPNEGEMPNVYSWTARAIHRRLAA